MATSNRNFLIRNLNDPYTKDWIFWLWVIMVALPLAGNLNSAQKSIEGINPVAGIIDAAVLFFSNWFIFNWIPRTIRMKLRNRKG
jgi:hypothetical protein